MVHFELFSFFSLMRFTEDSCFARDYVDGILDALTGGTHRKYKVVYYFLISCSLFFIM